MSVRVVSISLLTICLSVLASAFPVSAESRQTHQDLRYFEFSMHNFDSTENFVAATSDSTVLAMIDAQLALPESERFLHIHGPIDSTDGGHNNPWNWHFLPNQWVLAQVSIELCDGTPSMVDADLWYWLTHVGDFCPWMSYVAYEIDFPCCDGRRGNLDGSLEDDADLGDLTVMIDCLFISLTPPDCWEEGNVDESQPEGPGSITLSDLGVLIDNLFISLEPLPDCP